MLGTGAIDEQHIILYIILVPMTYVMRVRYERGIARKEEKDEKALTWKSYSAQQEKELCGHGESRSVMSDSLRLFATVPGILQARILGWVAVPFSRGSSQLRDQTQVSHIAGGFFTS